MKITVATVCYNAESIIEQTIESVLNQTYQNIEYLIIDGKSKDGTMTIVNKYKEDSRVRIISEKDTGLYNAMNKAADICQGEYIIYMNAGDCFYNEKVIEAMVPDMKSDIVYGNVLREKENGEHLETYHGKNKVLLLLLMGKMMCHQSIFTRTAIMREYKFDETYRICADYDFIMRAKRNHVSMQYIDKTVSVVDNVEGISSQIKNYDNMREEDDRSLKKHFPTLYYCVLIPKSAIRVIRRWNEKRCLK